MITKDELETLYCGGASMNDIARAQGCSVNSIVYWMDKYQIERRTISEAIYQKHNPNGDPFKIKSVKSISDAKLMGLGIGLYWGEGTRSDKHSIRLGNTDPLLIKSFMTFLERMFGVQSSNLKFGLQIFSDINPQEALDFWTRELGVNSYQFHRPTVTISGSLGTYRKKSLYGVVTVIYHNKKLRDILVNLLPR
jgi:hypothetical protein